MENPTFFSDLNAVILEVWPLLHNHFSALELELEYNPQKEDTYACFKIRASTKEDCLTLSSANFVNADFINDLIQSIGTDDSFIASELKSIKRLLFDLDNPEKFQEWCAEKNSPFSECRTFFSSEQPIYTVKSYEDRCLAGESLQALKDDLYRQTIGKLVKILLLGKSDDDFSECTLANPVLTCILPLFKVLLDTKTIPLKYDANLIYSDIACLKQENKWKMFVFCAEKAYECQTGSKESFIYKAISIVMEKWVDMAEHKLHYSNSSYIMDVSAMIHLAARDMTEGLNIANHLLLQELSAILYEKNYLYGKIVFKCSLLDRQDDLWFKQEIAFKRENLRYIRKLLEMTSDETENSYMLLANCGTENIKVHGLSANVDNENDYVVQFGGYMRWSLYRGDIRLFSYNGGHYQYIAPGVSSNHMTGLEDYFTQQEADLLARIIDFSMKQKHGAMILIYTNSTVAKSEVERLVDFDRGIQLSGPIDLSREPSIIVNLSSIDGAVAIDSTGMCYGMGIIVDGDASIVGTPARGARYNSAKNYIARLNKKKSDMLSVDANSRSLCIALVISEDGSKEFLA